MGLLIAFRNVIPDIPRRNSRFTPRVLQTIEKCAGPKGAKPLLMFGGPIKLPTSGGGGPP